MVHALEECWRTLRVGGRLIDLRPHKSEYPIDIISRDAQLPTGQLDNHTEELSDIIASDKAISEVIQRGLFKQERKELFEYTFFWDTVDQMLEYITTEWRNSAIMPEDVISVTRQLALSEEEPVQIRIRMIILIASYRKINQD